MKKSVRTKCRDRRHRRTMHKGLAQWRKSSKKNGIFDAHGTVVRTFRRWLAA